MMNKFCSEIFKPHQNRLRKSINVSIDKSLTVNLGLSLHAVTTQVYQIYVALAGLKLKSIIKYGIAALIKQIIEFFSDFSMPL